MTFWEINDLVHKHLPDHRLYEWRTIEQWRNDTVEVARLKAELSSSLAIVNARMPPDAPASRREAVAEAIGLVNAAEAR